MGRTRGPMATASRGWMTEKLWVPSADYFVATIRSLASRSPHQVGGIANENSAFRQLPVLPAHRTTAVVSMCNLDTGHIGHFLMTGHPFGLTSSVFNFNRRATALTDIMVKEFKCIRMSHFDDRFGCGDSLSARGRGDQQQDPTRHPRRHPRHHFSFLSGFPQRQEDEEGQDIVATCLTCDTQES